MLKKIIIAVATVASMAAIVPAQARGLDDGHLSIHFETSPVRVVSPVRVYETPVRVYQTDWRDDRRYYRHDDHYYRHHHRGRYYYDRDDWRRDYRR